MQANHIHHPSKPAPIALAFLDLKRELEEEECGYAGIHRARRLQEQLARTMKLRRALNGNLRGAHQRAVNSKEVR